VNLVTKFIFIFFVSSFFSIKAFSLKMNSIYGLFGGVNAASVGNSSTVPNRSAVDIDTGALLGLKFNSIGIAYQANISYLNQTQKPEALDDQNLNAVLTQSGIRLQYFKNKMSLALIYHFKSDMQMIQNSIADEKVQYVSNSGLTLQVLQSYKKNIGFLYSLSSMGFDESLEDNIKLNKIGFGIGWGNFSSGNIK